MLMEKFPDLYLEEDSLGRTVYERNQGGRMRDSFAKFFVSTHESEAVNLIKRKNRLLTFLLGAFKDVATWRRVIMGLSYEDMANQDDSGKTFLHNIIRYAHKESTSEDFDWIVGLIKETAGRGGRDVLVAKDADGLTPYEYHLGLVELNKREEAVSSQAQRTEVAVVEPVPPQLWRRITGTEIERAGAIRGPRVVSSSRTVKPRSDVGLRCRRRSFRRSWNKSPAYS
jgi:hypothetical protein